MTTNPLEAYMCNTCNSKYPGNTKFDNWLLHHKPHAEQHLEDINLLDTSMTAILTYRLEPFTVEELVSHYSLSVDKATSVVATANRVISDIEDMLIDSMTDEIIE